MKQGTLLTTYAYDARHRIISDTDAGNNVTGFAYDDADRVTEKRLPGNRVYKYSYDSNGNVATVTTPRGKVHTFAVTNDNRSKSYTPPASTGAYVRSYNTERRVENTTLPSGAQRVMGYDDAGRLTSEDGRTFAYDGEQDRFGTITNGGQSIVLRLRRAAADVDQRRRRVGTTTRSATSCCRRRRSSPSARPSSPARSAFDDDRLATKSGPFTLERSGPARLGLEDHRRQALAELWVRRQRSPGDAHAEASAAPSASSRSSRSTTWAARASARSASTAPLWTRSTTATTAPASC